MMILTEAESVAQAAWTATEPPVKCGDCLGRGWKECYRSGRLTDWVPGKCFSCKGSGIAAERSHAGPGLAGPATRGDHPMQNATGAQTETTLALQVRKRGDDGAWAWTDIAQYDDTPNGLAILRIDAVLMGGGRRQRVVRRDTNGTALLTKEL